MAIDFEKLHESPHLLDILIQMEDVLDSLDVYVFKNWLRGEVVEGPLVRRHWLDMTLRYPFKRMPDPKAATRLLKHGIRVDYEKATYEADKFKGGTNGFAAPVTQMVPDPNSDESVWLVRVSIPRRLISQMSAAQHDFYDEEIDIDDVEDAQDDGMDDETEFHTDEQTGMGDGMPGGPPGGAPEDQMNGAPGGGAGAPNGGMV